MTALIGVFGTGALGAPDALPAMMHEMRNRASQPPEIARDPGAFVAASRHAWEAELGGWTGPLLHVTEEWLIAGDATLYYLRDLRRRLDAAGRLPPTQHSGALIAAALDTWGARFARFVEGDYAFIILDRRRHRVLLVRDTAGKRLLVWSQRADGTLVVASSPNAVVSFPGVSGEYNLETIVAAASGFMGRGERTSFTAVSVVAAGQTLVHEAGRTTRTADQWVVPEFSNEWAPEPSAEDADRLRALIEDATCERLPDRGVATIWMSGGSDSTAIFGAGRAGMSRHGRSGVDFVPVSMSFPKDDTGYEDDVIHDIGERWHARIHWIPIDEIPLFAEHEHRLAVRDDVMAHSFESMMRTLSRQSRALGARIALEGAGGDHLFHVSDTVLADHLFFGRWGVLLEALRARRQWPWKDLVRAFVMPHLSDDVVRWIGDLRGRSIPNFWDASGPTWVRPLDVFAKERRPHSPKRPEEAAAAFEVRRLLTTPHVARVLSWNHAFGLDEGTYVRSPLFDRRVVEFAATRPVSERNSGRETKVLLRRSMRDLLPQSALTQRPYKHGTLAGYVYRQFDAVKSELQQMFGPAASRPELERMGVIDRPSLMDAIQRFTSGHEHYLGAYLHNTLETERWLAHRSQR